MLAAIKKGFVVATNNLKLALIVYATGIIFGLVSLPFATRLAPTATGIIPRLPGSFWLIVILSILVQIFIMGGILGCLREAIKKGKANLSEFVNFGKKYYVRLLLSGLLGMVIAIVYGFIVAALVGGMGAGGVAIKAILGVILALFIILGIALVIMFVFWPYAIVTEESGVIGGLKKSIGIATKPIVNLFKILVIVLLLIVIVVLLNLGISIPQFFFRQLPLGMMLYRIFIVGGVAAYINIALVSSLMAYYFTLKGEVGRTTA